MVSSPGKNNDHYNPCIILDSFLQSQSGDPNSNSFENLIETLYQHVNIAFQATTSPQPQPPTSAFTFTLGINKSNNDRNRNRNSNGYGDYEYLKWNPKFNNNSNNPSSKSQFECHATTCKFTMTLAFLIHEYSNASDNARDNRTMNTGGDVLKCIHESIHHLFQLLLLQSSSLSTSSSNSKSTPSLDDSNDEPFIFWKQLLKCKTGDDDDEVGDNDDGGGDGGGDDGNDEESLRLLLVQSLVQSMTMQSLSSFSTTFDLLEFLSTIPFQLYQYFFLMMESRNKNQERNKRKTKKRNKRTNIMNKDDALEVSQCCWRSVYACLGYIMSHVITSLEQLSLLSSQQQGNIVLNWNTIYNQIQSICVGESNTNNNNTDNVILTLSKRYNLCNEKHTSESNDFEAGIHAFVLDCMAYSSDFYDNQEEEEGMECTRTNNMNKNKEWRCCVFSMNHILLEGIEISSFLNNFLIGNNRYVYMQYV